MAAPVAAELGEDFDLAQALKWGSLPLVVQSNADSQQLLHSHVHTYLREEILEEGGSLPVWHARLQGS